jgi:riboflavin kinase / FMN adenylyltransferase
MLKARAESNSPIRTMLLTKQPETIRPVPRGGDHDLSIVPLSQARRRPRRVALGTFDGVHAGHRRVVVGADTVVTFSPHPRSVVGAAPKLLADLATKAARLSALGVEEIVLVPFDEEMAAREPCDFVDGVLVEALGTERVAVGENFRFGRGALGAPVDLVADPRFETRVCPLLSDAGGVVSSTRIRGLIEAGELAAAAAMLEAPFTVGCRVVGVGPDGAVRLRWPEEIVRPATGVYSVDLRRRAAPGEVSSPVDAAVEAGTIRLLGAPSWSRRMVLGTELELSFR